MTEWLLIVVNGCFVLGGALLGSLLHARGEHSSWTTKARETSYRKFFAYFPTVLTTMGERTKDTKSFDKETFREQVSRLREVLSAHRAQARGRFAGNGR
ncbi:MAG: hypothetical protein WB699_08685 [Bacteroidota bacterium]